MQKGEITAIDKGKNRAVWENHNIRRIKEGAEGEKSLVSLKLGGRTVEVFIKECKNFEEQRKKWLSLKKRGVDTLTLFRSYENRNGETLLVNEDLTEKGANWVVSTNNPLTTGSPEFLRRLLLLTPEDQDKILRNTLDAALACAKKDSDGNSLAFFTEGGWTNPITFVLSKEGNLKSRVMITDLGFDITSTKDKEEEVVRRNLKAALRFLGRVVGIFSRIPEDHPAYAFRDVLNEKAWKSLESDKKEFDLNVKNTFDLEESINRTAHAQTDIKPENYLARPERKTQKRIFLVEVPGSKDQRFNEDFFLDAPDAKVGDILIADLQKLGDYAVTSSGLVVGRTYKIKGIS